MPVNQLPIRANFGLLPEPQRNAASLVTSAAVNLSILALVFYIGMTAKRVIQAHKYEQTELIFPTTPPPPMKLKMKVPPPPKIEPPKVERVKLEAPKINIPKPEPKPEVKPIQMEAKLNMPVIKQAKPAIVLAPQPKAALAAAAAPAQVPQAKPSTAAVHLGETFGVTPNPAAAKWRRQGFHRCSRRRLRPRRRTLCPSRQILKYFPSLRFNTLRRRASSRCRETWCCA